MSLFSFPRKSCIIATLNSNFRLPQPYEAAESSRSPHSAWLLSPRHLRKGKYFELKGNKKFQVLLNAFPFSVGSYRSHWLPRLPSNNAEGLVFFYYHYFAIVRLFREMVSLI